MDFVCKGLIGTMLLLCSFFDIKTKRVPLTLIFILIVIELIFLPLQKEISILEGVMGFGLGIALLLISRLTRGQIGLGDGAIFLVTGLGIGFWNNLWLLFFSLSLAACYSVILVLFKHVGRRHRIPFVPFIFGGYLGVLLC